MPAIGKFLAASASTKPSPGGGSAAALAGALGCALGLKICRILMKRPSLKEKRKVLSRKGRELRGLLVKLTALIDRDARAYEAFLRAQRSGRHVAQAKREALAAPLAIRESARAAHRVIGTLLPLSGRSLGSDLKAAQFLLAGARSAAHQMVLVNS